MILSAKKKFGQNFLVDQNIVNKILDTLQPEINDTFLEIGGGTGSITLPLQEKVSELNVVEIDERMIKFLCTKAKNNLNLFNQDALKFDLKKITEKKHLLRVVGNLPYNISTPLIFHLLKQRSLIKDMHFMLQKEVVDRIVASPGTKKYGRLSIMISIFCEKIACFNVSPNSFKPIPKIWSTFIKLNISRKNKYNIYNLNNFEYLVKFVFSMRRKTLGRSLKNIMEEKDFISVDIDPKLRPENLEVSSFVKLSNYLYELNK